MFVDSHCHLDKLDYKSDHSEIAEVIEKAKASNVTEMLSVGVTLDSFPDMMELISPFDNVYVSCGVHPLDVVCEFSSHSRVIAIGETGLDYHYQPETKTTLHMLSKSPHILPS